MKILMINQPLNNRGDESAHKALIKILLQKIPNVQITVMFMGANDNSIEQFKVNDSRLVYLNKNQIPGFYKWAKLTMKKGKCPLWKLHPGINRILRLYRKYDLVLCAPGGICMGGFQDWHHLIFLKMAQVTGRKLVYFGRSFGPFPTTTSKERKFKELSIEMLNYFKFISIRDNKSQKLAQEIGIKYTPTLDSAFMDSPHAELPEDLKQSVIGNPYMVMVPNSLVWHYAFKGYLTEKDVLEFWVNVIKSIGNQYPEMKIVMLPQTFNATKEKDRDRNLFEQIKKQSGSEMEKRIWVAPETYSSDIQQAIIGKSNFVIGARYHSIVFALNQAIPFIALNYEHKMEGLLEALNKKDCMVDLVQEMDTAEKRERLVKKIVHMIPQVNADTVARDKAKEIALKGFEEFMDSIIEK